MNSEGSTVRTMLAEFWHSLVYQVVAIKRSPHTSG